LDRHRPIEAVGLLDLFERHRADRGIVGIDVRRPARRQMDHGEENEGDSEEERDSAQQTA
jgi:hypothetical protein